MEALSPSSFSTTINFSSNLPIAPHKSSPLSSSSLTLKFRNSTTNKNHLNLSYSFISRVSNLSTKTRATSGRWREFSAGLPGTKKDYGSSRTQPNSLPNRQTGSTLLFPEGNTKGWLVRMDKPGVGVVTKAQMVDFYSQILTKVMQNEQDAQMCIYNVSWQSNFGFCCELDEECAKELAGVPGVLSVEPDKNFESDNKNYGGGKDSMDQPDSSEASQRTLVKTKKLFVTGLSFYTSEKTLRAAFEGFGELVGVKIIMDKISKRSKGYAFVEYTTEEAASAALKEMNGKIINGWMIVVDAAKSLKLPHKNTTGAAQDHEHHDSSLRIRARGFIKRRAINDS